MKKNLSPWAHGPIRRIATNDLFCYVALFVPVLCFYPTVVNLFYSFCV